MEEALRLLLILSLGKLKTVEAQVLDRFQAQVTNGKTEIDCDFSMVYTSDMCQTCTVDIKSSKIKCPRPKKNMKISNNEIMSETGVEYTVSFSLSKKGKVKFGSAQCKYCIAITIRPPTPTPTPIPTPYPTPTPTPYPTPTPTPYPTPTPTPYPTPTPTPYPTLPPIQNCCPYKTSSGMQCIPAGQTIAWADKCLYIRCIVPKKPPPILQLESAFNGCNCCVGQDNETLYEAGAVMTLPSGVNVTCCEGNWVDIVDVSATTTTPKTTTTTVTEPQCDWTNWIDQDNPSGTGDWEQAGKNCVESGIVKYEVRLVSGGEVYTNVEDVPHNILTFDEETGWLACENSQQNSCQTTSDGYAIGDPCCLDYKARFCCNPPADTGNCTDLTVRKSVGSLTTQEIQQLGQALQNAQGGSSTIKYEDIANNHGGPYLCDLEQTGSGNSRPCCRAHVLPPGHPPDSYRIHFLAWHRLFVYQMEWAIQLHDPNVAIPYWEWTAAPTAVGWPLAGTSWDSGPIKTPASSPANCGGGSTTHRGASAPPVNQHEVLKGAVEIALDETTCLEFNKRMESPHNSIHGSIGCDMGGIYTASYDPIFYLNHAYVDYIFAYWQELQALRGLTACGSSPWSNVNMEPFNRPSNPDPTSMEYSKAEDTIDYQGNFCYKYDQLLFDGMTPADYLELASNRCAEGKFYAGLTRPYTMISSHQSYAVCYSDKCYPAGDFYTFGINITGQYPKREINDAYITKYDITEVIRENGGGYTPTLETISYQDLAGNQIPTSYAFKPILIYKHNCSTIETVYIQIPSEPDCSDKDQDKYAEKIYMDPPYNVEIIYEGGGSEIYSIHYQEETIEVYNECEEQYEKMTFGYNNYFNCERESPESLYPGEVTVLEWSGIIPREIHQGQGTRLLFAWCVGEYSIIQVDRESFFAGTKSLVGDERPGPMSYAVDTSQAGTFYFVSSTEWSKRTMVVVTENQLY